MDAASEYITEHRYRRGTVKGWRGGPYDRHIHEATRHPAPTTATEQQHGHPALTTATNLCGVLWMSLTTSERTHTVRPRKTWMQRAARRGGSDGRIMSEGQVSVQQRSRYVGG